jgi:hypothetical protein
MVMPLPKGAVNSLSANFQVRVTHSSASMTMTIKCSDRSRLISTARVEIAAARTSMCANVQDKVRRL